MKSLFLILFLAFNVFAAENPDVESTEKILQAEAQVIADFGGYTDESAETLKVSRLNNYQHLDPKRLVPTDLLQKAVNFFDVNKSRFKNQNYITIVDFAPRSDAYRLFIINLKTGVVERYHTTHGVNSDTDRDGYAESFSNVSGSKQSSLGYVRTAEVYSGSFGRSLRLDGLSTTNSNIRARSVVFHGWQPTVEAHQIQAMSWGCITTDLRLRDRLIDFIKDGSLMLVSVSKE